MLTAVRDHYSTVAVILEIALHPVCLLRARKRARHHAICRGARR